MDEPSTNRQDAPPPEKPSFWKTAPGVLTAVAALVTAIGALIAAADKAGLFPGAAPAVQTGATETPATTSTSGDNSPVIDNVGGNVTFSSD